ncbi:hypothetical protein [Lactococcus lactis]|uniref:hypothetical protein n=1 Tax=Lactococcus lactis TaxID=1358 RepID=UPI0022E66F4D|nr:hypothetical protein [Lactococcus lactis]
MNPYLDKLLDVLVNLITAPLLFLLSKLWYSRFSKIPIRAYFSGAKFRKGKYANNRKYFKIGWKPNGVDRFNDFLEHGYFAIAWPEVGDLKQVVDKSEQGIRTYVRSRLEGEINNKTTLGQVTGYFVRFFSIEEGDIVVTSRENHLYMYKVKESYFYSKENAVNHTAHRIKIDKKSEVIFPLSDSLDISPKFKRAAQNRLTIISLNDYSEQIELLLDR